MKRLKSECAYRIQGARRTSSARRAALFGLASLVGLGACSESGSETNANQPAGGTSAAPSGGAGTDAAGASAGTSAPPSSGTAGVGMASSGTGVSAAGRGGTAGAVGGAGVGAASGAAAGRAGAGAAGGSGVSGSAADGGGAAPAAGSGGDAGCTRELLQSTTDAYFEALAAHDAMRLPLGDGVKFTENGVELELGQSGLWTTAGMVQYAHSALDTESCMSVSEAVVPDGSMDIPVAVRLKLENQKLTEIEMIAVRPGDYKVGSSDFPSNTGAIIAAAETVKWEEPVPAEQRNTRQEIQKWIEKYFRMFPRGVCDVTSSCRRLENGGGSFSCTLGASCAAGDPPASGGVLDPRLIVVDVETGIGIGFTMFMGNTDMHMVKMYGGQVHAVHTILGAADSSGWD